MNYSDVIARLTEGTLQQRRVRKCITEGMVVTWESWLEATFNVGLISMVDLDHLLDIIKMPMTAEEIDERSKLVDVDLTEDEE